MRIIEAQEQRIRWEMDRGRGGDTVQPFPVHLEPPFTPFHHTAPGSSRQHPIRPPQFLKVKVPPLSALSFLNVKLSPDDAYNSETREQLPIAFGVRYPVALDVIGLDGKIALQFVCTKPDAPNVSGQLQSHYPGSQILEADDPVSMNKSSFTVARGYRLRDSHLFQIRSEHRPESYTALVGILENLIDGEAGLFQVLFCPVRYPWQENILTVATDSWDPSKSSFVDLPDLPRKARSKMERPLFAVAVRMAASSPGVLARLERSFLSQFESGENGLEPVRSPYPLQSIVGRYPQTPGMLLNARELAGLAHLPDPAMVPGIPVMTSHEAPAPSFARQDTLIPLGVNNYRGLENPVGIPASWLTTHVAIFGVPGAGKSNLLTWFLSVIEAGHGLAFLDPAGDTAEWFLRLIPENRVKDVVYFNPGDREHPPALNVLEASDQREKEMLVGELLVSLKRLFHRSGELTPRMERILRQTVRTLIFSEGEKTLLDVRRLLRDEKYRKGVLATLDDPDLVDFWQADFARMPTSAIDPILNRLSQFFEDPLLKNIVVQPNLIDFYQVMGEGKILICNLSKGIAGEDAATLLGSFILSRLQLAAMARANIPEGERKLFPIIVDEFQNYAGAGTDASTVRSLLTEARKMGVPFVLATQYMSQLDREVLTAIFGTVSTFIVLRCGPIDARWLQREVGNFTEQDILNLDTGNALVRMGLARDTFNVVTPRRTFPEKDFRDRIVEASQQRYCRPVFEVEQLLNPKPESESSKERLWIVDTTGNVFTQGDFKPGGIPSSRLQAEATNEAAVPQREVRETQETVSTGTGVDKELLIYLEHIARNPFTPALQRDSDLGLSRYKGGVLRQRLTEMGWAKAHRIITGKRSGQIALLEVLEAGYQFLANMKIRVVRPRGRGGFVHKYYAYKLKQYAEATWKGCVANIEDDSQGRPVDVSVNTIDGRTIAFEVFVTGEDKEVKGIVQDTRLFDEVIVCAEDAGSLERLKSRAISVLDADMLTKVTFNVIAPYLATGTEDVGPKTTSESLSQKSHSKPQTQNPPRSSKSDNQVLITTSEIEKSRAKSETEIESKMSPQRRRGRRPKTPLMEQVLEAYSHLHDLDWLQESELTSQPPVQEQVNPIQTMPEAQALRGLLIQAAKQVISDLSSVPDKVGVRAFLEGHLEGKTVTEIAEGLGVSREWVSRAYRREAFSLASTQFIRMVSREDSSTK